MFKRKGKTPEQRGRENETKRNRRRRREADRYEDKQAKKKGKK